MGRDQPAARKAHPLKVVLPAEQAQAPGQTMTAKAELATQLMKIKTSSVSCSLLKWL